jgi:ABC-2 type transport system permease protein
MIKRMLAVAVKELLHLKRDPRTALTLLGMPMVLLMIYGYALSFDIQDIRLAVVDLAGTRLSRDITRGFESSGYFRLVAHPRTSRDLDALLDRGTAQAGLVIPARLDADVAAGRPASLQLVLDGADAQTAGTVLGYSQQIVAQLATTAAAPLAAPGLTMQTTLPVSETTTVWYNPDLDSARFLVPGLLGFILMVSSVIATALSVVREKERGTIESLRSTPLVASELLLGKTLPYLLVAAASAAAALVLAWALFGLTVQGSLVWLAVVTLLYLAGGLGWGLMISTLADSQQVAFQLSLLSSMLPTILISGFIFPISSMPKALQVISHIVPARYYIAALRDIVLKGAPPEIWWPDTVALMAYAVVVLGTATIRMRRSL